MRLRHERRHVRDPGGLAPQATGFQSVDQGLNPYDFMSSTTRAVKGYAGDVLVGQPVGEGEAGVVGEHGPTVNALGTLEQAIVP